MGTTQSTDDSEHDHTNNQKLIRLFDEFIQANCECGENQYVTICTLESAFLYFLEKNDEGLFNDMITQRYPVSTFPIVNLCRARGFEITIGRKDYSIGFDTRHVVGVTVVRFGGKQLHERE